MGQARSSPRVGKARPVSRAQASARAASASTPPQKRRMKQGPSWVTWYLPALEHNPSWNHSVLVLVSDGWRPHR